jgi:alpha-glucosidase
VPRQPLTQSTAETPDGPLELHLYPGPEGRGALYWDDGKSLQHLAGGCLRQALTLTSGDDGLALAFERREGRGAPWWKEIEVVVHGWERPSARAALDGAPVQARVDPARRTVCVRLPDVTGPAALRVD